jgi:two-component system OmpR family response regulator
MNNPAATEDKNHRILVVDDEQDLADLVTSALGFAGYTASSVGRGLDALTAIAASRPDLIVLDVMLPDIDGFEVCRRLRSRGDSTPVIFLTARDASEDTMAGFDRGGDDYLTKPFRLDELLARIAAVLRRTSAPQSSSIVSYSNLVLDDDQHVVIRGDRVIELSPTEYRLLHYFLINPERVLSKFQIVEQVWGHDFDGDPKVVETYVSYLRKKIDANEEPLIQTVRGFGYALRSDHAR